MRHPGTHGKDKQTRPDLRRRPEGSSACAVRELTHTPRASLAVPLEELGEETLEEDEVDVEDLATEAGPGVPGAQHSSLRGAEGSARHSCHAKAAL